MVPAMAAAIWLVRKQPARRAGDDLAAAAQSYLHDTDHSRHLDVARRLRRRAEPDARGSTRAERDAAPRMGLRARQLAVGSTARRAACTTRTTRSSRAVSRRSARRDGPQDVQRRLRPLGRRSERRRLVGRRAPVPRPGLRRHAPRARAEARIRTARCSRSSPTESNLPSSRRARPPAARTCASAAARASRRKPCARAPRPARHPHRAGAARVGHAALRGRRPDAVRARRDACVTERDPCQLSTASAGRRLGRRRRRARGSATRSGRGGAG